MADDKKSEFAVITNRAIPVPRRGRAKRPAGADYPFVGMHIGDMFVVAGSDEKSGKVNIQKARNAAQMWAKEHGPEWRFQTRDISGLDNGSGGRYEPFTYGVWRVVPQQLVGQGGNPTSIPVAPIPMTVEPVLVVNPETEYSEVGTPPIAE